MNETYLVIYCTNPWRKGLYKEGKYINFKAKTEEKKSTKITVSDKRLQLSIIIPQLLIPLVVPEKERKRTVFSFRPIDSIVYFKLEDVLFHYLMILFL